MTNSNCFPDSNTVELPSLTNNNKVIVYLVCVLPLLDQHSICFVMLLNTKVQLVSLSVVPGTVAPDSWCDTICRQSQACCSHSSPVGLWGCGAVLTLLDIRLSSSTYFCPFVLCASWHHKCSPWHC